MASILLVDDDPGFLELANMLLESAGHVVTKAPDGEDALEHLDSGSFELMITDIIMPKVEGIELIIKCRGGNPDLPILALSASKWETGNYLDNAKILGATSVMAKPIDPERFLDAVKQLLK